jgi:hypothetical protein
MNPWRRQLEAQADWLFALAVLLWVLAAPDEPIEED